jgi:hypothetical protein
MTLVLYRCDLKVAEMIVCRKDQFIRRAVPSALPYEAWREGNDSSWNPATTYPAIEISGQFWRKVHESNGLLAVKAILRQLSEPYDDEVVGVISLLSRKLPPSK